MKTVFLKVEVPDDPNESEYIRIINLSFTVLFNKGPVRFTGGLNFTEAILPTIIDVQQQFPTFDEEPKENIYRAEGAFWVIDNLRSMLT